MYSQLWWKVCGTLFLVLSMLNVGSPIVRRRRQNFVGISAPFSIGPFNSFAHGCSASDIRIIDEQTIEIVNHFYDGQGPAGYYVLGNSPNFQLERADLRPVTVAVPEHHYCGRLPAYNGETVRVKLPHGHRVQDYTYFGQYCFQFNHNFCYVRIPKYPAAPKPIQESTLSPCKPLGSGIEDDGSALPSSNGIEDDGTADTATSGSSTFAQNLLYTFFVLPYEFAYQ